jgi:hypothetical protein
VVLLHRSNQSNKKQESTALISVGRLPKFSLRFPWLLGHIGLWEKENRMDTVKRSEISVISTGSKVSSKEERSATIGARKKADACARSLVLGLLLFAIASSANAQQLLDYGTFNGYSLGKGFLGNDYTNPLPACITWTPATQPRSHAGVRVSITYSSEEYRRAFHIDQQAEASFLGFGGSDELHFGQETGESGSVFDIVVEAYGEHDAETINHPTWDPSYATKLASEDPVAVQQVREECGDRYIQTVFYETRLFAVLHVSHTVKSDLLNFAGKGSGSFDIDLVSAKAALGGDVKVSSAHTGGAIGVDIYSEGLGGVLPTAAALGITSEDGLDGVATKLAAYLSSLHETGQPVKYQLTSMPGMKTKNLADQGIFDNLNDLKSKYHEAYFRLTNVNALLKPIEPRRLLFKQPQADSTLKGQQKALSDYVKAVAKAHDDCRKAPSLDSCQAKADSVGDPPPWSDVEVPPVGPPLPTLPMFAIDGTPVPPGQSDQLFSNSGKTLLDAAKDLKPDAKNVDVLLPIQDKYVSHLDIIALAPEPPWPDAPIPGHRLLAQNLTWPAYWQGARPSDLALHLAHADSTHPCDIVSKNGNNVLNDNCLTPEGRLLWDAVTAASSQTLSAENPTIGDGVHTPAYFYYSGLLEATVENCFGQAFSLPIARFYVGIWAGAKTNELSGSSSLFLTMTGIPFNGPTLPGPTLPGSPWGNNTDIHLPLGIQTESHDKATWTQLALSRRTALATSVYDLENGGPNLCSAHIP